MNSTELIQAFRIGVDKVSSLSNPSFETDEILFFLNKAKDRFEENLYLGRNSTGQSFDETERVKKALAKLTEGWSRGINGIFSPIEFSTYYFVPYPFSGLKIDLPSDCKYVLREYSLVTFATSTECITATDLTVTVNGLPIAYSNAKILPITAVRHNDLANLLQDPFIKPDNNTLLRIDVEDDAHVLLYPTNTYTISAYFMQYLRSSDSITVVNTYELPDWTHQKIVDIAVSLALENIESVRTQTSILDQIKND